MVFNVPKVCRCEKSPFSFKNMTRQETDAAWYVLRVTYQRELPTKEYIWTIWILRISCRFDVVRRHSNGGGLQGARKRPYITIYFVHSTKRVIDDLKKFRFPFCVMWCFDNGETRIMMVPEDQMQHLLWLQVIRLTSRFSTFLSLMSTCEGDRVRITGEECLKGSKGCSCGWKCLGKACRRENRRVVVRWPQHPCSYMLIEKEAIPDQLKELFPRLWTNRLPMHRTDGCYHGREFTFRFTIWWHSTLWMRVRRS